MCTSVCEYSFIISHYSRWLTVSADQIVILILLIALVIKFIFFENREDLHDQIRQSTVITIAAKSSQTQPLDALDFNLAATLETKSIELMQHHNNSLVRIDSIILDRSLFNFTLLKHLQNVCRH